MLTYAGTIYVKNRQNGAICAFMGGYEPLSYLFSMKPAGQSAQICAVSIPAVTV